MESVETFIIGAGPSGLAVAACLQRAGRAAVQVDQADAVGATWRNHYARLHLHTVKQHSALPGLPFPTHCPTYPSRQQVVDYLEAYAAHHGLRPRLGVRVEHAERAGQRWRIETSAGDFDARFLVVAAGYNRIPNVPEFAGQADFSGRVLHAHDYDSGAEFSGQRVLVVGAGNTGAEIALDLFEHGATQIDLCVRGPIHVAPRDASGVPAQKLGILWRKLPVAIADPIAGRLARMVVGDLSRWGLKRPKIGPVRQVVEQGRIPLIDVGTVELIKQGAITVRPGIERFYESGVRFVEQRRTRSTDPVTSVSVQAQVDYDVVVLATGYRPRLSDFLVDAALDERGYPTAHGQALPGGLFFCGYANPISGALRESGIEAQRITAAIGRAP